MRTTIKSLLVQAGTDIPPERWFQAGSVDEQPEKPFGVFRIAMNSAGVTARNPSRPCSVELWVHDNPGDYTRIDAMLKRIEGVFDSVVHASAVEGESISQAQFVSRSPDLNDDGFNTICRMTNYTLIGKG